MAKMSYGAAVKAYYGAAGRAVSFPKKGSEEHAAIRALMASGDIAAGSGVSAEVALASKEVKVRKPRKKGDAAPPKKDADIPTKAGGNTTLIDQPHINKESEAAIDKDPVAAPVKKRKPRAVKADGLSPQQQHLEALTEQNAGIHIAPAAYPDLKDQIKKVLEVKPEGIPERKKRVVKANIEESATQSRNKAPDMPAIEARAPFSFSSIKQLLRQ